RTAVILCQYMLYVALLYSWKAYFTSFFLQQHAHHRDLHSFPTRRSSDLRKVGSGLTPRIQDVGAELLVESKMTPFVKEIGVIFEDRKSTRLNSSHQIISYAVFCLKKKN